MKILDRIAVLLLIFWGSSILFTMAATPIYIPTNSARGFLFLSPHQGLSFTFWTIATLKGMKWHLTMVLVFISLMTSGVQHLSMHLVAFYQRYLWYLCGETSIQVLCPIFNFFFCCWVVWVLFMFWILTPYFIYIVHRYFYRYLRCLFTLLMVSSAVQRFLIWCRPTCLCLLFLLVL